MSHSRAQERIYSFSRCAGAMQSRWRTLGGDPLMGRQALIISRTLSGLDLRAWLPNRRPWDALYAPSFRLDNKDPGSLPAGKGSAVLYFTCLSATLD